MAARATVADSLTRGRPVSYPGQSRRRRDATFLSGLLRAAASSRIRMQAGGALLVGHPYILTQSLEMKNVRSG